MCLHDVESKTKRTPIVGRGVARWPRTFVFKIVVSRESSTPRHAALRFSGTYDTRDRRAGQVAVGAACDEFSHAARELSTPSAIGHLIPKFGGDSSQPWNLSHVIVAPEQSFHIAST
jgi:hypothetical protein